MSSLVCAAALLAATAPVHAQRVHDAPARPALAAAADTNSAAAYYRHGTQVISTSPREAAAAFYWANRLRPGWGDALYGRRVALLMTDPRRLVNYLQGNRGTRRSAEIQALDSLQLRALMQDPFLHQRLDKAMLGAYFRESYNQYSRTVTGRANDAQTAFLINDLMSNPLVDPWLKAWFAYSDGRFPAALGEYERALGRPRAIKSRLYTDIARIHFLAGNASAALDNFVNAMVELRTDDGRDLVHLYESKAVLEHSVATIHERSGNTGAAREAYGRALQEDLAYYPAHMRLGALAVAAGDTAAALAEFALAAELAPAEPAVHYQHALVLVTGGRIEEADDALERAIALEPLYAAPYFLRGAIFLQRGMNREGAEQLDAFLQRAARDDPQRPAAEQALATARAASAGS